MTIAPKQMCVKARAEYGITESILAFSCGKDSLAAWCVMADAGIKVYPVYHYVFPRLPFVERSLAYYEKRFDTPIIRLPHPWLCDMLYWGAFTDPQGMVTLTENGDYVFHRRSYPQFIGDVRGQLKKPDLWYAVGVKSCDSVNRMQVIGHCKGFDVGQKKWYPVAFGSDRINLAILRRYSMPVPDDYLIWGRSFDCFTSQFIKGLAQQFPEDYKRVLECFPLVESQLLRERI